MVLIGSFITIDLNDFAKTFLKINFFACELSKYTPSINVVFWHKFALGLDSGPNFLHVKQPMHENMYIYF